MLRSFFVFWVMAVQVAAASLCLANDPTLIVSAEGLVDLHAEKYKSDKGLLLDDLRNDARKQVIEKVVGLYLERESLVENYSVVHDRIFSRSSGMIKRVIKESDPWVGEDGFMHLLLTAEVIKNDTAQAVRALSIEDKRLRLIDAGDPRIAVTVSVHGTEQDKSTVAENILKEKIQQFGYRILEKRKAVSNFNSSEQEKKVEGKGRNSTDFLSVAQADYWIEAMVSVKPVTIYLRASGIKLKKFALASWTMKCIDVHTREEVYFNNKIPKLKSWVSEDQALEDIGRRIGDEFSAELFRRRLSSETTKYEVVVDGLPSYDAALLFEQELVGVRAIFTVGCRSFHQTAGAYFDIHTGWRRPRVARQLNAAVVKPFNRKLGYLAFEITSVEGERVRLQFTAKQQEAEMIPAFKKSPSLSLWTSADERLDMLTQSKEAKASLERLTQ